MARARFRDYGGGGDPAFRGGPYTFHVSAGAAADGTVATDVLLADGNTPTGGTLSTTARRVPDVLGPDGANELYVRTAQGDVRQLTRQGPPVADTYDDTPTETWVRNLVAPLTPQQLRTKTAVTTALGTAITPINGLAILEFTVVDREWEVIVDVPWIVPSAQSGCAVFTVTDATDNAKRYGAGAIGLVASQATSCRFTAHFDKPGAYAIRLQGLRITTTTVTVGSGIEPPAAGGVYTSMVARKTATALA